MTRTSSAKPAPSAAPETAREKLLASALRIFGECGYDGASIRDIARDANTNVALVSYHFGGKERLYKELLRSIVVNRVQAALDRFTAAYGDERIQNPSRADARDMLKTLLGGFANNALSSGEILLAARLIVREQTQPTAGFDIVFGSGMETLHKTVTRLFGIATGRNPETQECIIRAHMLFGQILSFVFANAAICRRLGKNTLDRQTRATISAILSENIDKLAKPART
ncbi:AcrR family transcriptional regulator [Ereboglobus sp. PH5-10]|uniref:CerR family C-terminal domain-containing protein n=1 Tax=Ereboglobus sp. PH5-10 TaxID=2940629 RepID=UPI002406E31C|nr:CerR family C-terminal domain-containing protein [Ereboglobus sp. PH5-10]MDF9826434.1 AcrR family transcriptional regulator [Ereboglobus sp. PH5-10]